MEFRQQLFPKKETAETVFHPPFYCPCQGGENNVLFPSEGNSFSPSPPFYCFRTFTPLAAKTKLPQKTQGKKSFFERAAGDKSQISRKFFLPPQPPTPFLCMFLPKSDIGLNTPPTPHFSFSLHADFMRLHLLFPPRHTPFGGSMQMPTFLKKTFLDMPIKKILSYSTLKMLVYSFFPAIIFSC